MSNAYLELKLARELFGKAPQALSSAETTRLKTVSTRQHAIEQSILASPEAAQVVVPGQTLDKRIGEISQRYENKEEFRQDMQAIGLSEVELRQLVEHDLRIEATLEKIAADVATASTVDAEIYYRLHPEAFTPPDCRHLRHILITFNNDKEKAKALNQLEMLRSTLENSEKFATAALSHSQCPTAVDGGKLGLVKRGQLYPELEEAAFALHQGDISPVLESPIGLHILFCDHIPSSTTLQFGEVESRIIEKLTDKRRQEAQKEWIKALSEKARKLGYA